MTTDPVSEDTVDPEVPTHRRTMAFEVFERDGEFEVVGELSDVRPWATADDIAQVHDMVLSVTVRRADLTITCATATMRRYPHHECPGIEDAFGGLVGLSVARGYSRAVQERFGRALGCAHLELLARMVGPVVIQAIPSSTLRQRGMEEAGAMLAGAGGNWLSDTCHVWRAGGPGPAKLAIGWRPGTTAYPAPSLEELSAALPGEGEVPAT
jgi:hypothetical protein